MFKRWCAKLGLSSTQTHELRKGLQCLTIYTTIKARQQDGESHVEQKREAGDSHNTQSTAAGG